MELFGIRKSFNRRNFIGRGGYLEICRIAYPLIIMSASNSVMQFVDRWFLAHHSTLDVAAAMPAGILYFTLFCFFMVTCNFTSAMVAQYHGAHDRQNLLRAVWAGQTVAVAAGLFITFIIPVLGLAILGGTNHNPELVGREMDYFISLLPSGVFVCAAAPFYSFFSGQGRTLPVAVINIGGCLLNIPLNWLFIFGHCGLPPLGIYGAGIASSICAGLSMIAIVIYFYSQNQRKIPTRRRWEFHPDLALRLFRYGAPAGFQTLVDVGAFTLLAFLIGDLGPTANARSVKAPTDRACGERHRALDQQYLFRAADGPGGFDRDRGRPVHRTQAAGNRGKGGLPRLADFGDLRIRRRIDLHLLPGSAGDVFRSAAGFRRQLRRSRENLHRRTDRRGDVQRLRQHQVHLHGRPARRG